MKKYKSQIAMALWPYAMRTNVQTYFGKNKLYGPEYLFPQNKLVFLSFYYFVGNHLFLN